MRIRAILLLFISTTSPVFADEFATLYSKEGVVQVRQRGQTEWADAQVNSEFHEADVLRTAAASRAALVLSSGVMVRIGAHSIFRIESAPGNGVETVALDSGDAHFLSRKPKEFPTIKTPLVSAAIRGTELSISTTNAQSKVALFKGAVFLKNQFGELDLNGGELGLIEAGKAPVKSLIVDPLGEIQWTLYYPNLIEPDEVNRIGDKGVSEALLNASTQLERGQASEAKRIHQSLTQKISQLPAKEQQLALAIMWSQEAIIDLTENRGADAAVKAERAQKLSPSSLSATVTASYISQSKGDLKQARSLLNSFEKASGADGNLLARQAELLLSFGESKEALQKSEEACRLMPESAYAHSVRGFAQLARLDPESAIESFERARKLSPADGLPYLGEGLARIRRGHLKEGRILIQQAAHLEPQRSLYRSYLGKAFFEEEDEDLAAEEYDRAIALDPEDPTPYLYRSFHRTSRNRPVEALDDLEKSISINDNRAVYRSSFLLDQDLSVRSNSLAQVYDLLGFSQVSRVEAIKSLSKDYSNHSAHLMLSQSYDGVGKLIQGGISEFFISRLLSPVNFNLVRPSQAGVVSSNEYSAVFDRDITRKSVGVSGFTRDKSVEPEARVSGVDGRLGYAMAASATYSDGYRNNDSSNEQNVYGTLQYQLTPDDTLLFDANSEVFDNGDTEVGYNTLESNPNVEQRFDDYFFRLGYNHKFSAKSTLIAQVVHNRSNFRLDVDQSTRPLYVYLTFEDQVIESIDVDSILDQRIAFRSTGTRGDMQHIYDSEFVSNVFGGGILDSNQDLDDNGVISDPEELQGIPVRSDASNTEGSQRLFNYTTLHAASWLDFQMGVAYSKLHLSGTPLSAPFQDTTHEMTKWDPKVGVVLTPLDQTTIRAAYFENLGTAGIRELELVEPTILSGFNQTFFDIFPGTASRNFALGVDQKLDTKTYFGFEGLSRAITRQFPLTRSQLFFDAESGELDKTDVFVLENDAHIDEEVAKAYVYQVLGKSTTLTLDYQYAHDQDNFLESEASTDRVRAGLNYFHPSGLFLFTRGTFRNQDLSGYEVTEGAPNGNNNFWVVDCGLGYRFRKRSGQVVFALNNILDENFNYLQTGLDTAVLPGFGASLALSYNWE